MGIFDDFGRLMDASAKQPRLGFGEALRQSADAAEQANTLREATQNGQNGMGGYDSFNPFANMAAMNQARPGSGTVVSLTDTGQSFDAARIYDVELDVTVDGQAPYRVVHRQMIAAAALANWQPGRMISLRVATDDPTKVMLG